MWCINLSVSVVSAGGPNNPVKVVLVARIFYPAAMLYFYGNNRPQFCLSDIYKGAPVFCVANQVHLVRGHTFPESGSFNASLKKSKQM